MIEPNSAFLVVAPEEKIGLIQKWAEEGHVYRGSPVCISWEKLNEDPGSILTPHYAAAVFLPYYSSSVKQGWWSGEMLETLVEARVRRSASVWLIPSEQYRISNPTKYDLERLHTTQGEWSRNSNLQHQVVNDATLSLIQTVYGLAQLRKERVRLRQDRLGFKVSPYHEHLLRRWLKKHKYQYRLLAEGKTGGDTIVCFPDLDNAAYMIRPARGNGVGFLMPLATDNLLDPEDLDILFLMCYRELKIMNYGRGDYEAIDLIVDWPVEVLTRPEFGDHALADLAPHFQRVKDSMRRVGTISPSKLSPVHGEQLGTSISNLKDIMHKIETWNLSSAMQSRNAGRLEFHRESREVLRVCQELLGVYREKSTMPEMAKGKGKEPLPPPSLTGSRTEAEVKIRTQIEKGRTLENRPLSSSEDLNSAEGARSKWWSYGKELLTRLFSNSKFADEFAQSVGVAFGPLMLEERINEFKEDMQRDIGRLESILERLDLVPEPGGVSTIGVGSLTKSRRVFVVHGHDEAAKQTVARFLEELALKPVILHEQPNRGRTVIEKFETYSDVEFAVVLLTPDDVGAKQSKETDLRPRARQNVILELGFFVAKLGRDHVCALCKGDVEIPSDYHGVIYEQMDASDGWKLKLAKELKEAGIDVDLNRAL